MKKFTRQQEDALYVQRPMLSEIVKAIENAWADISGTTIRIDKHGYIQVKYIEENSFHKEFFNYEQEPKLCFENETFSWFVRTYAQAGDRTKIRVGHPQPYLLAMCTIPHKGHFYGQLSDIEELKAAVLELQKAQDKVDLLLTSETTEVRHSESNERSILGDTESG